MTIIVGYGVLRHYGRLNHSKNTPTPPGTCGFPRERSVQFKDEIARPCYVHSSTEWRCLYVGVFRWQHINIVDVWPFIIHIFRFLLADCDDMLPEEHAITGHKRGKGKLSLIIGSATGWSAVAWDEVYVGSGNRRSSIGDGTSHSDGWRSWLAATSHEQHDK